MVFSLSVLLYFYNQFWYPPDDGAYAHVADRILSGEVLNLDIHDVHMGYINFLHAIALKLFGYDMASLRIPLVIFGVLQTGLIFALLKSQGRVVAFIGAVTIASLSFIQFLNPTANWYGLFLTILVIFSLEKIPESYKFRMWLVGYILVTLFLFRQLSGVITSLGVLSYIFYKNRQVIGFWDGICSKIIFAIMIVGLSTYLYLKTPLSAIVLFGLWPLLILVNGLIFVSVDNKKTLKIIGQLLAGGLIALAPLLTYHIYHGSVLSWYHDTVISALLLTDLSFIQNNNFFSYLIFSVGSIVKLSALDVVLNGIYWVALILMSFALGLIVFAKIRGNYSQKPLISSLPIVAVFYGLVSVHYQIPIYLYYTVGLSICGVLCVVKLDNAIRRNVLISFFSLVSFVALYFHAAQPLERTLLETLEGKRIDGTNVLMGEPVNLWIPEHEAEVYEHIQELVQLNVRKEETIFAFPSNSEIYFIAGRKNPFRFFNSSFGIRNEQQFDDVLSTLKSSPPRMVFYNPDDKYNTENAIKISQYIRHNYVLLETVNGMEYYLLRD